MLKSPQTNTVASARHILSKSFLLLFKAPATTRSFRKSFFKNLRKDFVIAWWWPVHTRNCHFRFITFHHTQLNMGPSRVIWISTDLVPSASDQDCRPSDPEVRAHLEWGLRSARSCPALTGWVAKHFFSYEVRFVAFVPRRVARGV